MQLKTSNTIKFFDNIFRKKFKFTEYESAREPTVFLCVYGVRDAKLIQRHMGTRIVFLNGTDSTYQHTIDLLKKEKDIIVIAGSEWVKRDLNMYGIKYMGMSLFFDNIYKWKAVPLGKSLYWYEANNSRYGKKYLRAIKRAIPDLDIIILEHNSLPRDEMSDVYEKCFAGVRPVEHDGQSQTVAEMGLMGRYSIWNGKSPFSVKYKTVDDIIEKIKTLRKGYNYKLVARRSNLFFRRQETAIN